MEQVQKTVEHLARAYEEFKASQDERLTKIERKVSVDSLLENKVERLNAEIEHMMDGLKKVPIVHQRPSLSLGEETPWQNHEHKAAFAQYLRQGDLRTFRELEKKSLSTEEERDGKLLIPEVVSERIGKTLTEYSIMRRLANVINISSSSVDLLVDKNVAEVGWVSEKEDRKETATPQLQKLQISVHEVYAKPRATQKLLDDARIDVESWLVKCIAQKIAQAENLSFIRGDGQNKPKGILNYPTVAGANWEWGKFEEIKSGHKGAFAQNNGADVLIRLLSVLKPEYHRGAVWLMSRSAFAAVRMLKDTQGHYLWQPSLTAGVPSTLLGYPVEISEDLPVFSPGIASKSIFFGNFKEGYQIVDRTGIKILRDPYSAKPYVEFYTTKRVGGDVVNFEALKVINFSD